MAGDNTVDTLNGEEGEATMEDLIQVAFSRREVLQENVESDIRFLLLHYRSKKVLKKVFKAHMGPSQKVYLDALKQWRG